MLRRTLLEGLVAQVSRPVLPNYKLSIRVEPLFRRMPLDQQMAHVAEAHYQGFEFGNWRAADPAAITALKNKLKLECACIVGNKGVNPPGMTLTDPRDRAGFRQRLKPPPKPQSGSRRSGW